MFEIYKMVCKKKRLIFLALFVFNVHAFSANGHVYVGASLAASYAKLSVQSPQISYSSGALITDAYPLNDSNVLSAMASINGGYEFTGIKWKPTIALGAGLYSTLIGYPFGGQLVETAEGDTGSALYNYRYHVNSTRAMAEIQLTWMLKKLLPFISLGVGPTWNTMRSYKETPVTPNGYTALPPFQSHTNVNLAYQAGFGVGMAFNFVAGQSDVLHERVSIGYRYVDLGLTHFGTRGIAYPYKLNTGRLETNDIYLSYTHLF